MTYLGMQILIEGLALSAFGLIRDLAKNPLASALNAYVMQDESRHVAFGRLSLRDYYPTLTDSERKEREQFVVEACYHMRDRFLGEEVWQNLGLPVDRCIEYVENSEIMREYRKMLFTRIVPTIKDIGLWGPKVQKAFRDMGVYEMAAFDIDALMKADEDQAESLDQSHAEMASRALEVDQAIAAGAS